MKGRRSRIGRASPSNETQCPTRSAAETTRGTATQTRTGGRAAAATPGRTNAPTQITGHAPSQNPKGTANPNAHRRHSRRSKARLKQPHPRETKDLNNCAQQDKRTHARLRAQTTRTRQRRAAQAAQTAVGDAQERILLRDDHVANTASIRFQRTSKSAFLFGGPGTFLFGKHKKKCPRTSPPPSQGGTNQITA